MSDLQTTLVSGAEVSRLLNIPRPRVADALRAASVQPASGYANSAQYRLGDALQAVMADLSRGDPSDPAKMRPTARNAHFAAALKQQKLRVMLGEYVKRDAVRATSAKALSALVQNCRGIRDTLERRHGVAPHVAAIVDECIDDALDQLAQQFQKLHEVAGTRERELSEGALAHVSGHSPTDAGATGTTTGQSAQGELPAPHDPNDISDLFG